MRVTSEAARHVFHPYPNFKEVKAKSWLLYFLSLKFGLSTATLAISLIQEVKIGALLGYFLDVNETRTVDRILVLVLSK